MGNQNSSFEQKIEQAKMLRHDDVEEALRIIRQVIIDANLAQDLRSAFKGRIALGNILVTMGDYKAAMDSYHSALNLFPEPQPPELHWHVYNGIAIIDSHVGRLADAAENYQKASHYASQAGELKSRAVLLINLANIYIKQD